jgi:hypothetical protein
MKKTTTLAGGLAPLWLCLFICAPLWAQSQSPSTFYLTDGLGNLMAELITGETDTGQILELGLTTLPEDQCSLTATYYLYGFDAGGRQRAGLPLVQAAFSGPENGSSATVRENAAGGVYALDVDWEEGEAWLSITVSDGAGAQAVVYLHNRVERSGIDFLLFNVVEHTVSFINYEISSTRNAIGDTLRLLPCNVRSAVTLKLIVASSCLMRERFEGIEMSAGSPGVTVASLGAGFSNEKYFRLSFNGPGSYTFNLSYTTPGGQLFTSSKSITVVQEEVDDAPICIAALSPLDGRILEQDTIDVPRAYCAQNNQFVLSFFVSSHQEIRLNQLQFTPGNFSFTESLGLNSYYIEIQRALNLNPQGPLTSITFGYQGYQKTFYFRVVPLEEPILKIDTPFSSSSISYNKSEYCLEAPPLDVLLRVYDYCSRPVNINNFTLRLNEDTLPRNWYINYIRASIAAADLQPGDSLHASYLTADGNLYTRSWPIKFIERWPDHWPPVFLSPPGDAPITLPAPCAPGGLAVVAAADDHCMASVGVADGPSGLPEGLAFIPFNEDIALLRATEPGQYAVALTATDRQGNGHTRTHLLEVAPLVAPDCAAAPVVVFADAAGQARLPAEAAYDQAGADLCADPHWALRVLDAMPEDGPFINGCGEYAYEVLAAEALPAVGFTGAFAPNRWATLGVEDGQITFSGDEVRLNTYRGRALAACTAPVAGQWSFHLAGAGQIALLDEQGTIKGQWATAGAVVGVEVAAGDVLLLYRPANTLGDPLVLSEWTFVPSTAATPVCTGQVAVIDTVPPAITLAEAVAAEIPQNGQTTVPAETLAMSLGDNCGGPLSVQARRQYVTEPGSCAPVEPYWSDWGADIGLGCCDLCDSVLVEVRAFDQAGLSVVRQAYIPIVNGRPVAAFYPPEPFCIAEGATVAAMKYFFTPTLSCVGEGEPRFEAALDLDADGLLEADVSDWVFFTGQRYGIGPIMAPIGDHEIRLSVDGDCALGEAVRLPFTVRSCTDAPPAGLAPAGDAPEALRANCFPNPFGHTTTLTLSTPLAGMAEIELFDAAGRLQAQQMQFVERGEQRIELGENLVAGVYFYRIRLGGLAFSGKVLKL